MNSAGQNFYRFARTTAAAATAPPSRSVHISAIVIERGGLSIYVAQEHLTFGS